MPNIHMRVDSPNEGARFPVGQKVKITGIASVPDEHQNPNMWDTSSLVSRLVGTLDGIIDGPTDIPRVKISYPVGDGTLNPHRSWEAVVTLPNSGPHVVEIKAILDNADPDLVITEIRTIHLVAYDTTPPKIQVLEPKVGGTVAGIEVPLSGFAMETESAIIKVECRLGSGSWLPATLYHLAGQTYSWKGSITLPSVIPSTTPWTAEARATNTDGLQVSQMVSFHSVDETSPIFTFEPQEGAQLIGTSTGAIASVRVRVSDAYNPVRVTSGVQSVQYRVNNQGTWQYAKRILPDDNGYEIWAGEIFVPAEATPTINVICKDNRGNYCEDTHTVTVSMPLNIPDLGLPSYLRDLMEFAKRRILRQEDGSPISLSQLTDAFCQPFAAIAAAGKQMVMTPVKTLRVVTEILQRFMQPTRPTPIAHWPLTEGSGTTGYDDSGNGQDGTVFNGNYHQHAGRISGCGLCFDGKSTYVDVADSARLSNLGSQATFAAWIWPMGAGGNANYGGIILGNEGEYMLARFPNGEIKWSICSNPDPGWKWIGTGLQAPAGKWTHVALVYDQGTLRTYVNGKLGHTYNGSGSGAGTGSGKIQDYDAFQSHFQIGGRQHPAGYPYTNIGPEDQWFDGYITDVAVFNTALTAKDICQLLNNLLADHDEVWVERPAIINNEETIENGEFVHPGKIDKGIRDEQGKVIRDPYVKPERPMKHTFALLPDRQYSVSRGTLLYAECYVKPRKQITHVSLEWTNAEGQIKSAYWGSAETRNAGVYMGGFHYESRTGGWVRLEVKASQLGLEGEYITGLAASGSGELVWGAAGKTIWLSQPAMNAYLATAYTRLLTALGTSLDELRLCRTADPSDRLSLASRLGVGQDRLPALLLNGDSLTHENLELLFGLQNPRRDLFAHGSAPVALLTTWRRDQLHTLWLEADQPTLGSTDWKPVLDPDNVRENDFINKTGIAWDLWQQRRTWVAGQLTQLQSLRTRPTSKENIVLLFGKILPQVDMADLSRRWNQGEDLSPMLKTIPLSEGAFQRLVELNALATASELQTEEWIELESILLQVLKERQYTVWAEEERNKKVVLDPVIFNTNVDANPSLSVWRATWQTRREWQDRLQARAEAYACAAKEVADAVSAAEEAALPLLRDICVALLYPALPAEKAMDTLTARLLVDVADPGTNLTTRMEQAIETLQGVLFGVRTSQLFPDGPCRDWVVGSGQGYTLEQFEQEWKWMHSYEDWRAAMAIFLYPENFLQSSLRALRLNNVNTTDKPTHAFCALVADLAARPLATAEWVESLGQKYWTALLAESQNFPVLLQLVGRLANEVTHSTTPYVLTENLSPAELTRLKVLQADWCKNAKQLQDVQFFFKEIFFYVPLLFASALQASGQYLSALDWFRSVYDYTQKPGESPIYAGFAVDATGPNILQRPLDWLLTKALDPYDFAEKRGNAFLRHTLLSLANCLSEYADSEFASDTQDSRPRAMDLYLEAKKVLAEPILDQGVSTGFPANPNLQSLRLHVQGNLEKIRHGLNIAGLERWPDTLGLLDENNNGRSRRVSQPTAYRYVTLMARAQQLLASAAQTESAYLRALEQEYSESYTLLLALHDLQVVQARVSASELGAQIAAGEVDLAIDQRDRSRTQMETYDTWIKGGLNRYEWNLYDNYRYQAEQRRNVIGAEAAIGLMNYIGSIGTSIAQGIGSYGFGALPAFTGLVSQLVFEPARTEALGKLADLEAVAQQKALLASHERKRDEWVLQRALAAIDYAIGGKQVSQAEKRSLLAEQELAITELQQQNTQDTIQFLATKPTNVELYRWMVRTLGVVYRYLLQQATAIAQLAEAQLAFERCEQTPRCIQRDYWTTSSPDQPEDTVDRMGLTGSARLLKDLTRLDQYAFETNKRKLQLSQNISFAQSAPVDLQRFRETGVLRFTTPMSFFDRSFPGHYMRTIRRVRVSVVALIPPVTGIRATLATSGISRVVVYDSEPQNVIIARSPEQVAFTSPVNASGVFELDLQPELMLPFEGMGVESSWEFQLPKAANAFDFRSIADIIFTIEYTAFSSQAYAMQVVRSLSNQTSGERVFSVRQDFPDEWYDLNNVLPDNTAPLVVDIPVSRFNFPMHLTGLRVKAVSLYALHAPDKPIELSVTSLKLTNPGLPERVGGGAVVRDFVGTRYGIWGVLCGADPVGLWQLTLANSPGNNRLFLEKKLDDLLLCITYEGITPAWPI